MASRLGLMVKREAVDDRLRSATNRLQARGVDVGGFPDEGRDRDLKELARAEHTASLLEACCDRVDELKEAASKGEKLTADVESRDKQIAGLKMQIGKLTKHVEELTAEVENLKTPVDDAGDEDPAKTATSGDSSTGPVSSSSPAKDDTLPKGNVKP